MYIRKYCLSLSCVVELPKIYHLVVCKYTQKSNDKALVHSRSVVTIKCCSDYNTEVMLYPKTGLLT